MSNGSWQIWVWSRCMDVRETETARLGVWKWESEREVGVAYSHSVIKLIVIMRLGTALWCPSVHEPEDVGLFLLTHMPQITQSELLIHFHFLLLRQSQTCTFRLKWKTLLPPERRPALSPSSTGQKVVSFYRWSLASERTCKRTSE